MPISRLGISQLVLKKDENSFISCCTFFIHVSQGWAIFIQRFVCYDRAAVYCEHLPFPSFSRMDHTHAQYSFATCFRKILPKIPKLLRCRSGPCHHQKFVGDKDSSSEEQQSIKILPKKSIILAKVAAVGYDPGLMVMAES